MDRRILFVEDDSDIREIVAHGLENAGFDVVAEGDGRQALVWFRRGTFDVVILDIMLPSLNGLEICRRIRTEGPVPIVMLTARTDTTDVIAGLEAGADDYVTKPFELDELIARLRAVLRRSERVADVDQVDVGDLRIDQGAFKAFRNDAEVNLTTTEFKLLNELARSSGRVMSREVLLETVWGYEYMGDSRIVDMAVKRLRSKIEDDPSNPRLIQTVRGVGYRLEP
ncbi:MAG: response regulator [Actinobacteria bacterium]|nr:response regulator [Actinomycetota bacterium]